FPAVPAPAAAATPGGGTVSAANPSISWTGASSLAADTALPEQCPPADPGNLLCDHFALPIDIPSNFWTLHSGGVSIQITWASSDNDFDLYVYNSGGTLVGASAQGGTTSEAGALLFPVPGAYEGRVVPFLVVNSGYSGSANLTFTPGPPTPNPTRPTGGIAVGPS